MLELQLRPGELDLDTLRRLSRESVRLHLHPDCHAAIEASTATVNRVVDEGRTVYGINTGFGMLAQTRVGREDLKTLQKSIVLSHAAGIGQWMSPEAVRLMMVLKINALAQGHSGIRLQVIEALIALVNAEIWPCVPEKGSVGASGDLAPLAHMATVLLGEGQCCHNGEIITGAEALQRAGLEPMQLAPKEGLALLNGTQASTALALLGLFAAQDCFDAALIAGALSVEAALGSRAPFDERIHRLRRHPAQMEVAARLRALLGERSEIGDSHQQCEKVQDPYSLRCQPQVMGACLQQLQHAATILLDEANAVTDNPLVFSEADDILSGGNFHAEPVAMAADNIALALAETGALSERRIALLIDSHLSKLPPFLVENGGVNSGFMMAQVTAAALASENKSLAHPASVDSLPTSANQEDHVSMATFAARRLQDMAENTAGIVGIELLAACQGIDFRRPLKTSPALEQAHARVREAVPFYDQDRYFAPDIRKACELVRSGGLAESG